MSKQQQLIRWKADVADHDYGAAANFLSLTLDSEQVDAAVGRLRAGKLTTRRANDILRASGLEAAALDDPGVTRDLIKVIRGKKLSPVLVLREAHAAVIADGYHRVSLIYQLDPYGDIPLKLV